MQQCTTTTKERTLYLRATIPLARPHILLIQLMSEMASIQKTGTKRTFSRRDSTNSQPPSVDASLFRALVRTKGETHKRDHYVPSGERDTAVTADTVSAYHVKKRDTTLPSARIAAVADFEFRPRGLNRDLLLTGTTTKGAWETRANSIQAQDGAAGAPLLITLFGQRISASEAGTIASLVCTSLERTYNCTGNEATLFLPPEQGGMNILDLEARNEAIYLVWAGKYMEPASTRPQWAYVADAIFKATVNKDWKKRFKDAPGAMSTPFTQDWQPTVNDLPLELKLMIKSARTHGVKLDGAYIDEDVRNALPIWYHFDRIVGPRENHTSNVIKCLRETHEVFTVGDAVICGHNPHDGDNHHRRTNCGCQRCREDRARGCAHPYKCQEYAYDLTISIGAKWAPLANDRDVSGDLDDTAKEENERALTTWDPVVVDPSIQAPKTVHETFRVFTKTLCVEPDNEELRQPGTHDTFIMEGNELTFTACGNAIHANTPRAKSGYAMECGAMRIATSGTHDGPQTKVRAATVAILEAARAAPKDKPLLIRTNSKRAVQRLTTQRQKLEGNGWRECREDANILRTTMATLRSRNARTRIVAVDEELDLDPPIRRTANKARWAAKKDELPMNDLRGPTDFDVPGIPLHGLSQRTAYKHIRDAKAASTPPRRPATENIDRVQESVAETRAKKPIERAIWRALMQRAFSREVRIFLWKALHDAQKTGDYFLRMTKEEHQLRGYCTICGVQVTDSLEHILLECDDPARQQIWDLAKTLWGHKHKKWFDLSYGLILGCGLVTIREEETYRKLSGATRLFRILISESANLIWKLRCIRRIDHADDPDWRHPDEYVKNEWFRVMTDRLHVDCLLTNKARHGRKALPANLVVSTWSGVLEEVHDLPELMLANPGFLVGNTRRQRTRPGRTARGRQRD